jgi:hypothetical protein
MTLTSHVVLTGTQPGAIARNSPVPTPPGHPSAHRTSRNARSKLFPATYTFTQRPRLEFFWCAAPIFSRLTPFSHPSRCCLHPPSPMSPDCIPASEVGGAAQRAQSCMHSAKRQPRLACVTPPSRIHALRRATRMALASGGMRWTSGLRIMGIVVSRHFLLTCRVVLRTTALIAQI